MTRIITFRGNRLTSREAQLWREGFYEGVRAHENREVHDLAYARREAERRCPMPTTSRPRVMTWRVINSSEAIRFRAIGERLEFTANGEHWSSDVMGRFQYEAMTHPDLLDLWADLLRNPTEEVEAQE